MKRLIVVVIVAVLLVAGIATWWAISSRAVPPQAVLPVPNGYDDFAAAAQWTVATGADLFKLPPEQMRSVLEQNAKVLKTVRSGLKKQSGVPVVPDMNWLTTHMTQVGAHKSMAQLLVADGMVHLDHRRTNEAARCFADCIMFAHAAHRRGLMIDELVAIACQAIGAQQLVQVAPHVSPDVRREILRDLISLDQTREPASAIVQRDREWSRGTYGLLGSVWARIFTDKGLRAAVAKFEKRHARSVAALRLVMTELAVGGHRAQNGRPPTALAELVPAWLPAVPLDPFSNGPLVYRVTTNSVLFYSVGPDGKDDEGTPLKRGGTENGDLLPNAL